MTTASGLIAQAMKKIGVLTKSETPDSDEAADGLISLNNLLSSWSNESLFVYSRVWESFSITGASSYTIGTSQTLNTTRPINIVEAHVRLGSTDYPLTIVPDEVYNAIPDKATVGLPTTLNFDNAFSTGNIRLYPVPDQTYSLYLLSEKQLVTLALTDTISLPAGWERALIYNLALEIAPEYGVTVDPLVVKSAQEAKGLIALTVSKNRPMTSLSYFPATYNILTGQ